MVFLKLFTISLVFPSCFSLQTRDVASCLKPTDIFIFLDLEILPSVYGLTYFDDLSENYELVKHLLRDRCRNVWLYSFTSKQWRSISTEEQAGHFFDTFPLMRSEKARGEEHELDA